MQFYTFKFPENAKCIKIRSLTLNVLTARPRGSVFKYNISSSVSADSSFVIQRAQTKVKESKYSLNKLHKFSTDNALAKKYYFYPSIIP